MGWGVVVSEGEGEGETAATVRCAIYVECVYAVWCLQSGECSGSRDGERREKGCWVP